MTKSIIDIDEKNYHHLISHITGLIEQSRQKAFSSRSQIMVRTYWEVGRSIVEYEQKGEEKAEYGSKLLNKLTSDLRNRYGKGYNKNNIYYMRLFYIEYSNFPDASGKLTWS